MATEREELRLTVTLVDNASGGLTKLKGEFKELTEGPGKGAAEKFKKENAELSGVMKKVTGDAGEVYKALGMMRLGALGAAGGFAILGYELAQSIKDMGEYADKVRAVNQAARAFGIPPETLRNIQEQLEVAGVAADQSLGAITQFMDKMGELQRNPVLRHQILKDVMPGAVPEMEKVLKQINDAQGAVAKLNAVRQAGINIEQNALKRGESPERAAGERSRFEQELGYSRTLSQAGELKELTEEQRKLEKERNENLEKYANLVGEIKREWNEIEKLLNDSAFAEDGVVVKGAKALEDTLESIKGILEFIKREGLVTYLNPFSDASRKRTEEQFLEMIRKKKEDEDAAAAATEAAKPPEQKAQEKTDQAEKEKARQELLKWRETHPFGLPPNQRSTPASPDWSLGGGAKPIRFMSGDDGGAGGGRSGTINNDIKERLDDFLRDAPMSTNIEDQRGEGGGDRTRNKYMMENTAELKRLNDYLVDPAAMGPGGPGAGLGLFSGGLGGTPGGGLGGTPGGGLGGTPGGGLGGTPGGGLGGTPGGGLGGTPGGGLGGTPGGGLGGTPGGGTPGGGTTPGAGIAGSGDVNEAIRATAATAGMDPAHWKAIADIESSLTPGSNRNKSTQYKGLFQIGNRGAGSEWARKGHGDIYNAMDNAKAAAALAAENNAKFKALKGRDPTPVETYMMHQQGFGFYKSGTMTNIAGNPYPGMHGPQTPASFEAGWKRAIESRAAKFADGSAGGPPAAGSAGGPPAAGSGAVTHSGSGGQLPASLKAQMEYAGLVAGVRTDVAHGIEPGHARHTAKAPAGDVDFYDPETGRKLDVRNPADLEKMKTYVTAATAAGATGIGFGKDGTYMGYSRMHVGGGTEAVWGAGGHGVNAPAWLAKAYEEGRQHKLNAQQLQQSIDNLRASRGIDPAKSRETIDRNGAQRATVEGSGKITVDVNAPKGTNVGAEASGLFKEVAINRQTQMEPARRGPAAGEE